MLLALISALAAQLVIAWALCAAENRFPARVREHASRSENLAFGVVLTIGQTFAKAFLGPATALAVGQFGGGLFDLSACNWFIALAIYVFAIDLAEYLFHRAQHAIPFLWAMHSLHHSDPDYGATTAARHFWLEPWIKSLTIWLAVALCFKASPAILATYALISLYHFFVHANLRCNLGRLSWLINAPAYHRVHHSALQEHFDCNYASLFPIFDVFAGSYKPLQTEEYPPTGLDADERPASISAGFLWPWRNVVQRLSQVRIIAASK